MAPVPGEEFQERLPVSVVVMTYNEEANIGPCLRSVAEWAGEIWVVDSGSTDMTLEIVGMYTDKVASHPYENYSSQRNWAGENLPLAYEWVFHIDAGETVTPELARSLRAFFKHTPPDDVAGMMVARRTVFMGRWIKHGGHYPVYIIRLFRKHLGHSEDRLYDEHFVVDGRVGVIEGDLVDRVMTDLASWTSRHMRWAELEARLEVDALERLKGEVSPRLTGTPIERRRWLKLNLYHRMPLFVRSLLYFFNRYFFRLGFLDGVEGLIFHFLQGFWFRFYVDSLIYEARRGREGRGQS